MGQRTQNAMPKYQVIKEAIRSRIGLGVGRPEERFCTQGELMREFGVSSITVRRALHDLEQEGLIRQVNGRGVFADPGAASGQSRSARTGAVSLLLRDPLRSLVGNWFYGPMLEGFEKALGARGWRMIAESVAGQAAGDLSMPVSVDRLQVDGVALLRSQRNDFLLRLMERGVPAVLVDFASDELNLDAVVIDNKGGARAAVEHLAGLGHRRIAHLAGFYETPDLRSRSVADRLAGYQEALASLGLPGGPELVVSGRSAEERAEGLRRLLASPDRPTALFCFSDNWALQAIGTASGLGLRVPDDLSVVGFGGMAESSGLPGALGLTTLHVDSARMGLDAARMLIERMDGHEGPARRVTIPATLNVGNTTARRM